MFAVVAGASRGGVDKSFWGALPILGWFIDITVCKHAGDYVGSVPLAEMSFTCR